MSHLAIFEELEGSDVRENIENLEGVADANAAIGRGYSTEAVRLSISHALRISQWRAARSAYKKSLDTWLEVKRRSALTAFSAREPARISDQVTTCDAALAKLGAPIH